MGRASSSVKSDYAVGIFLCPADVRFALESACPALDERGTTLCLDDVDHVTPSDNPAHHFLGYLLVVEGIDATR